MEENKKSKLGLGILIGVLVTLVIVITGYIIYEKNFINEELKPTETENNKEIITDLSLESTVVNDLKNIFFEKYNTGSMSEYSDYFYARNKTDISNLPNKFKLYMVISKLEGPNAHNLNKKFDSEYKNIFGNENYSLEEVEYGCNIYYVCNNGEDFCVKSIEGCGGAVCGGSQTKLAYAKQITSSKETKIEIYEHFYYADCVEGGTNYYSDYAKTKLITSAEYINEENIFENYKEQLGMYKYTFVKNANDTYVFTTVEKVK